MKYTLKKYIYLFVFPILLLAGCRDDDLMPDGTPKNQNVVAFSAYSVRASQSGRTRGDEDNKLYEPLVLTGNGSEAPLYLHTYVVDKIGFRPGVDSNVRTRGNQIENAEDLAKFHKSFKVLANTYAERENYFGWVDTRKSDGDANIWYTDRTEYWPGDKKLAFYAVSPSTEFSNLSSLNVNNDEVSFKYEARKGTENKDAEIQPDLMLASSACNKAGSQLGRAPLKFHHALSAVKFAVRDVLEGEVVNITISGVKSKGSCRFVVDQDTGYGDFYWSGQDGEGVFSQDFKYDINGDVIDPDDDTKDLVLNDKMPEKTFMMIPQLIPDDAEITVTLKRSRLNPETIVLKGKITSNDVREWKAGYEYVYTISTTKENWTYVLAATGNHNSSTGAHNIVGGDQIYVYSPAARHFNSQGEIEYYHTVYGNNAFFNVRSFRYRSNDPSTTQNLSWSAEHDGTGQYRVDGAKEEYAPNHDLTAAEWVLSHDLYQGQGDASEQGEKRNLEFVPHHQLTDWPGDDWMQSNDAYSGNDASHPWDLSTCGGKLPINTANCYVIDRQGWYTFPLVYGNAIKEGHDNPGAYKYPGTQDPDLKKSTTLASKTLPQFKKHSGTITKPEIDGAAYAKVLWSDVYNAITITGTGLDKDKKNVVFQANKENMQQGNVVIAVYDSSDKILWSWHIWINEHWLDHTTGQPNAYCSSGSFSQWETSKSGWRQRGDVKIDNAHVSGSYNFYVAPYNIGWCDPKNVDYLRRKSEMRFVQYNVDGTPTGKTASIPMIQDGERVSFKEGNNTYYQWGRKDPFIGFVNHTSTEKRNFTELEFKRLVKVTTIEDAILHPEEFYYNSADYAANGYGEWSDPVYVNLWNNNIWKLNATSVASQKIVKTVYDPCPPGYVVPPAYFFRFIGTTADGKYTIYSSEQNKDLFKFNGEVLSEDLYTFLACAGNKADMTLYNTVWLTSTGERWDRSADVLSWNFNPHLVYLWSAQCGLSESADNNGIITNFAPFNGLSLALGLDQAGPNASDPSLKSARKKAKDGTPDKYVICSYFPGRKTMARPVRPIREQ